MTQTQLTRVLARPREALTAHTLEVVARVEQLSKLHTGQAFPRLWFRLHCAALLHDSGKLAPGFQRGLRSAKARWGLRHEVLSVGFVQWFAFAEEDYPWIVAAIATHHRDADDILNRYRERPDPADDPTHLLVAGLDEAQLRAWYEWIAQQCDAAARSGYVLPALQPFSIPTAAEIRKALNSLEEFVAPLQKMGVAHPDFAEATLLRGFMLIADHAGAARTIPFEGVRLQRAALTRPNPYPHQELSEKSRAETILLIAPTGSGKTDAALLRVAAEMGGVARLLYLLPYRASMDAMQQRLELYAVAGSVGLQHGRALQSIYRRLLSEGHTVESAAQSANERLNLSRLHAFPIRVCSPYYLLRGVYQFKGFEAILADSWNGWLIVDEIHAYDPERLALILETLRFLREQFNVRLFIMTATLAPVTREALDEALPDLTTIPVDTELYASFRRHRLRLLAGTLEDHLGAIEAAWQVGRAVLVVVNTVRRARAITADLKARGLPTLTLHSRFNSRDRWEHEQRVLAWFGVGARSPENTERLPIVIATQVIEVSLDIDFDVLFSDPAPLDALVQRFGRVNRGRTEPILADVCVCAEPTGAEAIHPIYDPALVAKSLRILAGYDGEPIDEARISGWLAEVYEGDIETHWREAYTQKQAEFRRIVLETCAPFNSGDAGLFLQFVALFDGVEILPLSLEEEYRARLTDDPIGASALLVPVAWWQYKMLERRGVAWSGEGDEADLYFTDAPYDAQRGLQIENDEET